MTKDYSRHAGYTLIELLLYVALIGMLLSAVVAFFTTSIDARVKNQSVSEVNDQGSFVLDYIAQTIRNGTAVSGPAASTTESQLTVTVPTASLSPTVFSVSGNALQVKEGTASAINLTNNKIKVDSFSISNLTRSGTGSIVQVSLTLSRINTLGRNEYDYQRTFTTSVGVRP